MSYRQITLVFDGAWVLAHKDAEQLPVDAFLDGCKEAFGANIAISEESLTECSVIIKDGSLGYPEIKETVADILQKEFGLEEDQEVVILKIEEISEAKDTSESKEAPTTPAPSEASPDDASFAEEKSGESSETMAKVGELIGAEEFKALIDEFCLLAPRVTSHKTFEAFAGQSYLFAINDGCGMSTCLEYMAKVLSENGLFSFCRGKCVAEVRLKAPGLPGVDVFEEINALLAGDGLMKNGGKLIAIDISEWMTKLYTPEFRAMLSNLDDGSAENIIVFRIPFVEQSVLHNIEETLRDVLFLRTVVFAPMNMEELKAYAVKTLSGYGFTADDDVWREFERLVAGEKSDGRFYGFNTVRKIVREMIYHKLLSDARNGKDDSVIITKDIVPLAEQGSPDETGGMDALAAMVGMEKVSRYIEEMIGQIEISRRNPNIAHPSLHMRFVGNPGTGKTTVARLVGRIFKERGILRNGSFFEFSGRDFCGRYVGETAPKTASMCRDAYGSVLFIDEAYSLYRGDGNTNDYGREALDTLIAEMENHRDDMVVIMAGYTDEMAQLMKGNPGLESRMPFVIEFGSYSKDQLFEIFTKMAGSVECEVGLFDDVRSYFNAIPDEVLTEKRFSNARFVRNLYERTCAKASVRIRLSKSDVFMLKREDFRLASLERAFNDLLMKQNDHARIGF